MELGLETGSRGHRWKEGTIPDLLRGTWYLQADEIKAKGPMLMI